MKHLTSEKSAHLTDKFTVKRKRKLLAVRNPRSDNALIARHGINRRVCVLSTRKTRRGFWVFPAGSYSIRQIARRYNIPPRPRVSRSYSTPHRTSAVRTGRQADSAPEKCFNDLVVAHLSPLLFGYLFSTTVHLSLKSGYFSVFTHMSQKFPPYYKSRRFFRIFYLRSAPVFGLLNFIQTQRLI